MRTGNRLTRSSPVSRISTPESSAAHAGAAPTGTLPTAAAVQRSPFHSPVPYLFGGLAAMLALIAVALVILACSYRKLSGHFGGAAAGDGVGSGAAEKDDRGSSGEASAEFAEKLVVVMAGDYRPSFLAEPTPIRVPAACESDEGKEEDERQKHGGDSDQESHFRL